ncbi:SseB family protein [Arthrobacter cryoconiti]|uniref:SseB family protein n=1 Tax=Arthrobacter cryoconiti TaxID=748907 RepID=A0ABV8R2B8_9MICC|nr:SseB family protein [Arthrobacter cryoconiti]MCC9067258.1 SseB family protein [Arthrobacter cryoconiti]
MAQTPKKTLPGHIAAALAGSGGATDSAGQPWAGRALPDGQKYHSFEADDGAADARYIGAVAQLVAGQGSEREVVAALAQARVFIPIIATLAEETVSANGLVSDKESDMALVTIQAPDGRRALPAFTNVSALADWHPQARPVAVYAARAALSAVAEEAQMLVLDPGSDQPFVVRRPAMWALAQQQDWLPSYLDTAVAAVLDASVAALGNSAVVSIFATPGPGIQAHWGEKNEPSRPPVCGGGAGPELEVKITLEPGLDQMALEAILATLQDIWARNEHFARVVDSVQIRLQQQASTS